MSGLLAQVLGDVLRGQQVQQPSALTGVLQQVLGGQGSAGGLAALLSRFESAGFGQHVQSWVGTGQNMPISGDQLGQVFSPQEITSYAQQAGTTPERMKDILAQALPHVIDHLTPAGQVPTQASDLTGLLGSIFGGGAPRSG